MYPVDFQQRYELAKSSRNQNVNCVGAAFYLLGLTDTEMYLNPKHKKWTIAGYFDVIGRELEPGKMPDEAAAIGIWFAKQRRYFHLGVVSPFDRDVVIHRQNYGHPLTETTQPEIFASYLDAQIFWSEGIAIDYLKVKAQLPSKARLLRNAILDSLSL